MSRFSGSQGKGAMRRHREKKRAEAAIRGLSTVHTDTKAHRLRRCGCGDPS